MKLWIPVLVAVYLSIAFGNLDRGGRSHQELYPISAMPMFMRIDSSDTNFNRLNRLRSKIEAAKESEAVDDGRSRKGRQQQ